MMYTLLFVTLCFLGSITTSPVPTSSSCSMPCNWTPWINVYKPTNDTDDGDFETLENIRAAGVSVCPVPRDIQCQSARFPYIPFKELKENVQCNVTTGLTCFNKDNQGHCSDFQVQLYCCPCDEIPESPPNTTSQPEQKNPVPSSSPCSMPCKWTPWINVYKPTNDTYDGDFETLENIKAAGVSVCPVPRDIQCQSAQFPYIPFKELKENVQCNVTTGLTCFNKDNQGHCSDFQVQLYCCPCDEIPESPPNTTSQPEQKNPGTPDNDCSNSTCTWSKWFNVHEPTSGNDGGDFETLENIRSKYSICSDPQEVECRLSRFPYIPLMNLNYIVECGVSQGLVCLNKQQINRTCLDYEIRILCCTCNNTNDISVADYSKAQSYLSDVRFEDHKESYIIKQQSDSHTSDQIHYPAQPLVTPDNKIDSKIDEPIKELGSSKMQKHNHVTDSAFPLLDANSPIFVIDPVIYTTTPGDGPTEKKDYYPVPSAPLIVTFPPDNDYEYESFPLLEANIPEFVIDPVIYTTTPRGGPTEKKDYYPVPSAPLIVTFPPNNDYEYESFPLLKANTPEFVIDPVIKTTTPRDGPTEKKDYYPVPSAPLIVTFPPDNTDYEYKMSTSKMKTDKTQKNPQPTNSTDVGKEFS